MSAPSPTPAATTDAATDVTVIRRDFPVLSRTIDDVPVIYLDNAATTLKPRAVIDAVSGYYTHIGANVHRGLHRLSQEASTLFEDARGRVAQFIGARADEVVFVRNTTEALNLVAHGLRLSPDDLVVGTLDAHHSHLLPWRHVARLELTPLDAQGRVDRDGYEALLRQRPKVVALTYCSNVTGAYLPLEEMVRAAHSRDAVVVVDAAQAIGHRPIDVATLGVDFLAFSAHKMMGPTGVGVLYGRREHLERLQPWLLGGGTVDWVDARSHALRRVPHRFEAGTPDIAGVIGLDAAIRYLDRLGLEVINAHDRTLAAALNEGARLRPYLEVLGPVSDIDKTAILSLRLRGVTSLDDVARILSDAHGIMCRTGHHCAQPLVDTFTTGGVLRVSAYVYNTAEEISTFFSALDDIRAALRA
jgi:cysteine desulfurase / selenocysteine lyase